MAFSTHEFKNLVEDLERKSVKHRRRFQGDIKMGDRK
jgi:hypothetical protein